MSAGQSNSPEAAVVWKSPETFPEATFPEATFPEATFPEAFSTNPESPYVKNLVIQR